MRVNKRMGGSAAVGVAVVGGVMAALLATGTVEFGRASAAPAAPTVGFSPDPTLGASPALQTGQAFLGDWQRGDLRAAASLTDRPPHWPRSPRTGQTSNSAA